ncbi:MULTISPECIES: DUF3885 domain-containing protein [Bacillus]|uniref:DUF3885 domain-containing protein n=1 Tax=Bacillus zhangzhouensis TaxID=1178540 RepID=A0A081LCB2_9BACI|nr:MULTISPECIES: DUF3885 domain-containing protein [Bacillus]KEP26888.1 hypothetical protein BA70_16840 [Bacillus zhangzhouensis]MDR0126049.1 DUF3885 domain-containing protein [Bacillus zhangzhouensis]PRO40192.1 DUF3885 domain-containing protein [Bacillus sp. LLTC93]
MSDQTNIFLNTYFPNLYLAPPLFYEWPYGLRFEVADWSLGKETEVLETAGDRALHIVRHSFQAEDDVLLVTDVYTEHEHELTKRKLLVYQKYVNRKVRYRLRHEPLTYVHPEIEEVIQLERFTINCRLRDIRLRPLLHAICQEDFFTPNQIMKGKLGYEIYLINLSKQMIFHLYDDRGCDLIAADPERLRPVYEGLQHWLLDYDRAQMDRLFAGK